MEVLPAGFSDFRDRAYWNSFFQFFDKKNFEWYGNYGDPVNKNCLVINLGCGNSHLSYELFQDGFRNIVNLDYSDVVIHKMKQKFGDKMEFLNIDISNAEQFDHVLNNLEEESQKKKVDYKIFFDKAFLDAYISCEQNEEEICKRNAKSYFSLVFKHMNKGDLFLVITLAQYYIIKEVVRNVYHEDIMLEVFPFFLKHNTSEFKYHPFVFAFYRTPKGGKKFEAYFVNPEMGTSHVISLWKLPNEINERRGNLNLHIFKKGKRRILDIYNTKLNRCDYNVVVYDSCTERTTYNTVVVVVPLGYEFHSLYCTAEGNEELANKARTRRLLLVMRSNFLAPPSQVSGNQVSGNQVSGNQVSGSNNQLSTNQLLHNQLLHNQLHSEHSVNVLLESIKNELTNILNEVALPNSDNFPIMVLNESVKNCRVIAHRKSHYASGIIIRDVLVTEEFLAENFNSDGEHDRGFESGKSKKKGSGEGRSKDGAQREVEQNSQHSVEETLRALLKNQQERRSYFEKKEIYKRQMIFSYDPLTVQSELVYTREREKKKKKKKNRQLQYQ
ncbi:S-adenosyl-L-methionine-dependent methyltransferase [Plasmodium cynomolgi strain B]|uniref:S-adenosyl-L-methionine-dependent methyltransferase n=1 Tax=Plasmodium cynomolgi (strain B) TaxID=1120755 RepID=K6V6M2_PLACD|nr:S-adenosyl-L-methionine-dependent methyltransferase [Plasmodium cynomolgi strain B]GAB64757.1 S-adenosyl-L-methionine-dependent methyltransferase [Plasmodium cynomolgi strain B]